MVVNTSNVETTIAREESWTILIEVHARGVVQLTIAPDLNGWETALTRLKRSNASEHRAGTSDSSHDGYRCSLHDGQMIIKCDREREIDHKQLELTVGTWQWSNEEISVSIEASEGRLQ